MLMVIWFFLDGSSDRYLSGELKPVGQQGSFGSAAKTLVKPPRAMGIGAAIPFGRLHLLSPEGRIGKESKPAIMFFMS